MNDRNNAMAFLKEREMVFNAFEIAIIFINSA